MKKINYKTIGVHFIAWLTYAFIIFNFVSSIGGGYEYGLWFMARVTVLHSLAFYLNMYFLLPKLMEKNKYMAYSFSIILVLLLLYFVRDLFSFFEPMTYFEHVKSVFGPPAVYRRPFFADSIVHFIPSRPFSDSIAMAGGRSVMAIPAKPFPSSIGEIGLITNSGIRFNPRLLMDIFSSMAILFISTTYWVTKQAQKRAQMEINLKNENLDTELKLLKSQINPHFLFNALNNIYSLSYRNQKMAPDMVMKLSEMLRYVLYETNESKVTLDKEIAYINNYIDFQRLKTNDKANIGIKMDIHNPELSIEPMLLIPFIENSFKHSNIDHSDGWVSINLTTFGKGSLIFEVSNSKPAKVFTKDTTVGIGLENVKKRLKLLYPERHDLTVEDKRDSFTVKLVIIL